VFWKVFILANVLGTATGDEVPTTNPINLAYGWAQLLSTLTDRALWLFFLILILIIAWFVDRRKEKQLEYYRQRETQNSERLIKAIENNSECLKDLKDELKDLRPVMDRVERNLDR
jgi:Tfp pilus assembly protein PilO